MASFVLSPSAPAPAAPAPARADGVGTAVLLRNARWFTKVRWGVIGVILLAGVVGQLFSETFRSLGIAVQRSSWSN